MRCHPSCAVLLAFCKPVLLREHGDESKCHHDMFLFFFFFFTACAAPFTLATLCCYVKTEMDLDVWHEVIRLTLSGPNDARSSNWHHLVQMMRGHPTDTIWSKWRKVIQPMLYCWHFASLCCYANTEMSLNVIWHVSFFLQPVLHRSHRQPCAITLTRIWMSDTM